MSALIPTLSLFLSCTLDTLEFLESDVALVLIDPALESDELVDPDLLKGWVELVVIESEVDLRWGG
jgi:hypothetical protein